MLRLGLVAVAMFLTLSVVHAQSAAPAPQVGDSYEITLHHESARRSSDGSSGNSSGGHAFVERLIEVRGDDLELEYDLPLDATAEDRASNWQFPVRVFRPASGPLQLLNRTDLEARLERWLTAARFPRAACGSWIFTWNAFQIECDPQSVLQTIERIDLRRADIRDGAPYQDPAAREPGRLRRTDVRTDGATFVAEMPVDAEIVRRRRVESDLVVAEIMRRPLAREEAVRARAAEEISGTITVTLETDATGQVRRRIRMTQLETREPNGSIETETATETTERRPISLPPA